MCYVMCYAKDKERFIINLKKNVLPKSRSNDANSWKKKLSAL